MDQEIAAARRQQITETPISMLETLDKWRGQQFVQKDMELWGWHLTKTHMEITLMLRMQISCVFCCMQPCLEDRLKTMENKKVADFGDTSWICRMRTQQKYIRKNVDLPMGVMFFLCSMKLHLEDQALETTRKM